MDVKQSFLARKTMPPHLLCRLLYGPTVPSLLLDCEYLGYALLYSGQFCGRNRY